MKRGKPKQLEAQDLSRSASYRREAVAAATGLLQKPVQEARPSFGQSASFSKAVSSKSLPSAAGKIAGKRRAQKSKPTRNKSVSAALTAAQAFVRNQIDDTTNIAADPRSMDRIFQNSQPMPASTVPTRLWKERGENQTLGPSSSKLL